VKYGKNWPWPVAMGGGVRGMCSHLDPEVGNMNLCKNDRQKEENEK